MAEQREQIEMSKVIAKAVAEATQIAIQTMAEMQLRVEVTQGGPEIGGPVLKQPQFNWDAADKYLEWKAFMLEVKNLLSTYNTPKHNKIAMVKNWLCRKGLHYIGSITEAEKQACNTLQGLFDTLATKFWLQFNKTIKSLQIRRLCRSEKESAEEWMGWLWMAAVECGYKEVDRQLREQFIHGFNDKIMLVEIIIELTSRTGNVPMKSKGVLAWAKRGEAQRVQAVVLKDLAEIRVFDKIKKETEPKNTWGRKVQVATHQRQPCRYCGGSYTPRQCPAYGKMCAARLGTSGKCAGAKETMWSMKLK